MRAKEVGLYRGNSTEDEGTLHSKRWTTKSTTRVPTTLMTLGQPVRLDVFLRRQVEPSLHGSIHSKIMNPWNEGATEEGEIRDDGPI